MHINEEHPFVRGFRKRYSGEAGGRLPNYIKQQCEEFESSKPPAVGFKRVLTRCCSHRACQASGRCDGRLARLSKSTPLEQDGWMKPIGTVAMMPLEKVMLLTELIEAKAKSVETDRITSRP
mmetsp:Transcript_29098/g.79603  ORF Transcript_29098/g.79603 Transcript_29098/m.79603 type:complete len:122 (-) Transcript_29098:117-482(-)